MTNFFKALESADFNTPTVEIEYRLYYDTNGKLLYYSTEDLDGQYIVVDKETYDLGRYDLTVIDEKLVYPTEYIYQKLVPSDKGTECITDDVSVIGIGQKWSLTRYE